MKRVGNKSGQLVRSASRRKKTASRFQFDITVNSVSGVKAGGKYFVKWSRGVKVASTKHFVAEKDAATRPGQPIDQKLSLLVTLYREDGKKFDAKEAKLSLINVSPKGQERTVAKTRFDLSGFAGVPSASNDKTLKLSDKVAIKCLIESRFLKAGAGGPGSAGGSSALSGMTGVSGRSSEEEDDDFDDLVIDDVPEPTPAPPTRSKPPPSTTPAQPPSRTPNSVNKASPPSRHAASASQTASDPFSHASSSNSSAAAAPRMPSTANPQVARTPSSPSARKPESPSGRNRRERASSALTGEAASRTSRGEDEQRVARLSRDNLRLSAELEEMKRRQHAPQQTGPTVSSDELARLQEALEQKTREKADASAALQSTNRSVEKLRKRVTELEEQASEGERTTAALRAERDDLHSRARRLETSERKCAELSREVDRLTIAAAASQDETTDDRERSAAVEARISSLQAEKEQLEKKLKSHLKHSADVKATYDQLSDMYGKLREDHTKLQREAEISKRTAMQQQEQLAAASTSRNADDAISTARLKAELEQARDEVRALESGRAGSERECERLTADLRSLREQLETSNDATEEARREADELAAEAEELKGQRDMAMQRALSKGKSNSSSDSSKGRHSSRADDAAREEQQRELERLARKVAELEVQNGEMREDLDYEKSEKTKARDERDKIRETARALERRTSQAAKAADAMNSMRRELSTHQMRAQDHESIIEHMKNETERLQAALDEAERKLSEQDGGDGDEIGEVLSALVVTKLALAEAQGDKQQLEFAMKKLRKHEKAIQQRLAQHASRLEVKLGQATEDLERMKKQRRSENRNEFNELGSDVDY